jgi:2-oxoisovalerate dehydrogenase E1 component beta subunit
MQLLSIAESINLALDHAMTQDPNVVLLGQDIAKTGGVFRVTNGLYTKYGEQRVIDTPLAESMIVGLSVGMAAQGLRPIAEIQFMGFIFPGFNQIATAVARMRNRTRGRITLPMVIRMPYGGGIHAPEHHSESTEALLAHLAGLKVVIPSNPARAYGLLLAAIHDPDPVIFLEPKRIYRSQKYIIGKHHEAYPIGSCFIDRIGSDITLVSWGAMLRETHQVANAVAELGIQCEVIDVATISPLDMRSIFESVSKTGRCVIVQEAARNCSVASEIAAELVEHGLGLLKAPVARVTGYDTIMPYPKTEHYYMPSVERIREAVLRVMEYQ